MGNNDLQQLRQKVDEINSQLLHLLNERGRVVQEIGQIKKLQGTKRFDPIREREVLDMVAEQNEGPFETSTLQHIFKGIFKASLELQEDDNRKALLVSRKKKKKIQLLM